MYDSLNDDDDDIRDAAAAATKHIFGQATVPLEAANRLLKSMTETFGDFAAFKDIVVTRLVGAREAWMPAAGQLEAALKVDDALFAVEEQNLFVEEVRETKRWVHALEVMDAEASDPSIVRLNDWLLGGLDRLRSLFEKEDGPLGWSSRPQAFAIASSVILCSVSLVSSRHASKQLRDKVRELCDALGRNKEKNISGLFVQPLREIRLD